MIDASGQRAAGAENSRFRLVCEWFCARASAPHVPESRLEAARTISQEYGKLLLRDIHYDMRQRQLVRAAVSCRSHIQKLRQQGKIPNDHQAWPTYSGRDGHNGKAGLWRRSDSPCRRTSRRQGHHQGQSICRYVPLCLKCMPSQQHCIIWGPCNAADRGLLRSNTAEVSS